MRALARVAQAIEAPQFAEHLALAVRRIRQASLEPAAKARGVAIRLAVQPPPLAGEALIDARALEQHAPQLRREVSGILPAHQPVARDVLVDLRLHLELEE